VRFGLNSTPPFIEEVEFEIFGQIRARRRHLETTKNSVNWFCSMVRCGKKRMVELAAVLGHAQGPLWSLPHSPVATWAEDKGEDRRCLPGVRVRKRKGERGRSGGWE